ncbi:kinase-(PK-like) protein [Ceratobasidium theobromae]|uniref:ubiquitinyl hydrolase 1 n=1 Tax=Ceratobasidium theobromae TaxID=1582974 RepID=A0A5N5QLF4_9AGAM|nr:kinase-(PK-like) protein [Ceratobasidium theobromae]
MAIAFADPEGLSENEKLHHLIYHVFLPPRLPQSESNQTEERQIREEIARSALDAFRGYKLLDVDDPTSLSCMVHTLERVLSYVKAPLEKNQLSEDLTKMRRNDVLALYIRAQNAAVVIRKGDTSTVFEVFEVQAPTSNVMSVPGRLVRYYPGPAVEVSNSEANDTNFMQEIASFLTQMDTEEFQETIPTTRKAGSDVRETRDSTNPNYFTQLFLGILRGMGKIIEPPQVVKRIADEVLWDNALNPWRRSPIWLIVRVALQTSLPRSQYKYFMVFLHAKILARCLKSEAGFSSDLLFTMRVKLARRLYKLKDSAPQFLIDVVRTVAEETQVVLAKRWSEIQEKQAILPELDLSALESVDSSPVHQTLPHSRAYLDQVFERRSGTRSSTEFHPAHKPRLENIQNFDLYAGRALSDAFSNDRNIALFDFEASVFEHLSAWTNRNLNNASEGCKTMFSCFQQYLKAASSYYTVDIADQSIMILTLMQLWMAIDELATSASGCPLLLDFSPEIPENILDSLLLRTSQHIEHARAIQEHIRKRHRRASSRNDSIFSEGFSSWSFAVQYFQGSSCLKRLKKEIEDDAHNKKTRKIQELQDKNQEHARLDRDAQGRSHKYIEREWGTEHCQWCTRCRIERDRDSMTIELHEWPLPSDELEAEAAVFELRRPAVFTIWRDITYQILRDLGSALPYNSVRSYKNLEAYDALNRWLEVPAGVSARIIMGSYTKSFIQAHYSSTRIPTSEDSVCVNNGLRLQLYDDEKGDWATGTFSKANFSKYGTLTFPQDSPYRHLRYSIGGTSHTSNQVLADQYNCPEDLNLHEHIAFGTLRSGGCLQWMNMVRGIEENILNFSCEEVNLLHTQAAWNIGPLTDEGSREWHRELEYPEFGKLLVAQIRRFLERVRANWLEATSVSTAILLVARLLASCSDRSVLEEAYILLRECRSVTLGWLSQLQEKLRKANIEQNVIDYQNRVCAVAAICRSTFDLDPCHIPELLLTSEDFTASINCSIALYDNQPPNLQNSPASLQTLFCRDRRLSHKLIVYVLRAIESNKHILSEAISNIWPSYRAGSDGWQFLESPNSRWVSTRTTEIKELASQQVHLNLMEGRLLIDGEPLGRLPREYVQHPTYIRLFGQKILDVVPADSSGMRFATRESVAGYKVSFMLLRDDDQLVIQASSDEHIFELVPHSCLKGDFPIFLSTDFYHWANVRQKTVEFCSLSHPWPTLGSDSKWLLRFLDNKAKRATLKHVESGSLLVDIHSSLFCSIAQQLNPLESCRYLHVTQPPNAQIQVELPRMKLLFYINKDLRLESDNFRGQIIDHNQSVGVMFGLKNQLVLCAKDHNAGSLSQFRSVLIPYGNISFAAQGHHASVTIDLGSERHISFYRYKVDTDLNRLASDTGLTSRLFKIYLHALTSHCLPDPLTERTGTQEALYELSEASTSSFDQIDKEQARLLNLIGSLTPDRKYYPEHLTCMQTTHWRGLPSLSQHYAFSTATNAILRRADILQLFCRLEFELPPLFVDRDENLLRRATRRTNLYYPSDTTTFSSDILGQLGLEDTVDSGRESLSCDWEEEGHLAAWASHLSSFNWDGVVYRRGNLVSMIESWDHVGGPSKTLDLTYSSCWLSLNLSKSWIPIYNLCRRARVGRSKFHLVVCLASAAFSRKISEDLLPKLVAFATNPLFRDLAPPAYASFNMRDGYQPSSERLQNIISSCARDIGSTPSANLSQSLGESIYNYGERKRRHYNDQIATLKSQLVRGLLAQWPSTQPNVPSGYSSWFMIGRCQEEVQDYFASCSHNIELRQHIQEVEQVLSSRPNSCKLTYERMATPLAKQPTLISIAVDPWSALNLGNLIHTLSCPTAAYYVPHLNVSISKQTRYPTDTSRLLSLFSEKALATKPVVSIPKTLPHFDSLLQNRHDHQASLVEQFEKLKGALSPSNSVDDVIAISGIWPCVTARTTLQQLSLKARRRFEFSPGWRQQLISYAQLFVEYQKSQRLIALYLANNVEEIAKELDVSYDDDHTERDPDWLLVQIDGNFSPRSIQRQVAKEMISPSSQGNTALQLNMGEGKSSVIVPIISASLADTSKLVRVVVLKPLWRQMFHLLVNRLSGLANRRIYYLPFGRHIRVSTSNAERLRSLYAECMREGGILLAQPEHILSFKLMGIDQLTSSSNPAVEPQSALKLREIQSWLINYSRDILDESDEILHVRYQLVYTVGEQKPLEDHPDRWTTTQQLLHVTSNHISRLKLSYPKYLKHEIKSAGCFPDLRIMPDCESRIEQQLILGIAQDVIEGRLLNLNCNRLAPSIRDLALQFLTSKEFPQEKYQSLKDGCDTAMWKGLLLTRGLLAMGILAFALKNRHYRVDYGLDPSRSLLAVPYRAKDIPSVRAEFGHPDVAVTLTCLSYYYKGLTKDQVEQCFELLYKLDNPPLEYEQWVLRNESTPSHLRQLNGVNIKDREQFKYCIMPIFSHNSATIDFFLSSVVFPKAAKEFPLKLSTSGWDLAGRKPHVTTGFSGTNDNRYLLPTSIEQADPVDQLSTNALVLTYLLQPENNHYLCMSNESGETFSTKEFLRELVSQNPEVRVLLDVGAQMLELQNEELARRWLELRPEIEAAVYFNEGDEIVVLPQRGIPSPLYTSPFAQRLDKCIVYLDDGHTRGTDLKLPRNTRALVTLGPRVTKDRLLQGCMRMRKLGHGQSVMFAAPPEIDRQIRSASPNLKTLGSETRVEVVDVLRWAMLETCKDLGHHVAHWAQQGIDYRRRAEAEQKYEETKNILHLKEDWVLPESRSLEHLYGFPDKKCSSEHSGFSKETLEFAGLRERLRLLGIAKLSDPSIDEEQEREVSHEVERERQVERPDKGDPATHSVHEDIRHFVQTGQLRTQSSGILPLLHPLDSRLPGQFAKWSANLFASTDFFQTIVNLPINLEKIGDYMRPINWIVQDANRNCLVLSPFEVNELLPLIRRSRVVQLHVYAPRVTQHMQPFSGFRFYSIPSQLPTIPHISLRAQLQLDLFAGQLYLNDYDEYVLLCTMLGLYPLADRDSSLGIDFGSDGFINPNDRKKLIIYNPGYAECNFATSPIPVLKDLTGLRRKGMKYLLTHIGRILHSRILTKDDFA